MGNYSSGIGNAGEYRIASRGNYEITRRGGYQGGSGYIPRGGSAGAGIEYEVAKISGGSYQSAGAPMASFRTVSSVSEI